VTILDRLNADLKTAMKDRDAERLSTLRMVISAMTYRRIERNEQLSPEDQLDVLRKQVKQRDDSIEQFTKGGRQELAAKEAAEIPIIEGYLPKPASQDEITSVVRAAIAEMGSPTLKDMGNVMKAAMAKFGAARTRVDGAVVSETVKKLLSGGS